MGVINHHDMKGLRFGSTHSYPRYGMEIIGQLHALAKAPVVLYE